MPLMSLLCARLPAQKTHAQSCLRSVGLVLLGLSVAVFGNPVFGSAPIRAMERSVPALSVAVSTDLPLEAQRFALNSLDSFCRTWGEVPIVIRHLTDDALLQAVDAGEIDLFYADARMFAVMERHAGSHAVLSSSSARCSDPQTGDGLAVLVPKNNPPQDWHTILTNRQIVVPQEREAFLLTLLREIAAQEGLKLNERNLRFADKTTPDKIDSDAVHLADACAYEAGRDRKFADLVVYEPTFSPALRCRISGNPVPGPVLAATIRADAEQADLLGNAFLSFEDESGWRWHLPVDYRTLHDRLSASDQLYRSLSRPTAEVLWKRFGVYVFAGVALIAVLLGFALLQERRVKRRSLELLKALRDKEEANSRLQAVEKASVVSQMSSIVAHEIRQPLAAMRNYVGSLRFRLQRNNLKTEDVHFALEKMRGELERADTIVEHVRTYAKRDEAPRVTLNLSELVQDTAMRMTMPHLTLRVEPSLMIEADELEMKLIVENLLKNAREAVSQVEKPNIELTLAQHAGFAVLEVLDNGPAVPDPTFEQLGQPLFTTKTDGIGLGLSIVRRIVESYGGRTELNRSEEGSLRVRVCLPIKSAGGSHA